MYRRSLSVGVLTAILAACGGHGGSNDTLPATSTIDLDRDGVAVPFDCNDNDAVRSTTLSFQARDQDADGYVLAEAGSLCTGGSLPEGYLATAGSAAVDCDDTSAAVWRVVPVYVDADGDSVGAGSPLNRCIGAQPSPGISFAASDCAYDDAAVYASLAYGARDDDFDGHMRSEIGTICTAGTLPAGYAEAVPAGTAPDCDDGDATHWRVVALYQDGDGDGVGRGTFELSCIGTSAPTGMSLLGYDPLDFPNDPNSFAVSDFDLSYPFIDSADDDDVLP
jgi:hypothetical protein